MKTKYFLSALVLVLGHQIHAATITLGECLDPVTYNGNGFVVAPEGQSSISMSEQKDGTFLVRIEQTNRISVTARAVSVIPWDFSPSKGYSLNLVSDKGHYVLRLSDINDVQPWYELMGPGQVRPDVPLLNSYGCAFNEDNIKWLRAKLN
jgi:hypothetical protein